MDMYCFMAGHSPFNVSLYRGDDNGRQEDGFSDGGFLCVVMALGEFVGLAVLGAWLIGNHKVGTLLKARLAC